MELQFTKINGAGNDFVVVDDLAREIELTSEQVARICDRQNGVGADGVILVRPSERAECAAYMHYINADGSLAEMCGNGVRCFAKFLVDGGIVLAADGGFIADTLAGTRPIRFEVDADGKLTNATVEMGKPLFAPAAIPTTLAQTRNIMHPLKTPYGMAQTGEPAVLEQTLDGPALALVAGDAQSIRRGGILPPASTTENTTYKVTCVNMGNPHVVIFLDSISSELAAAFVADPASLDISTVGSYFEGLTSVFPAKINVEFAAVDPVDSKRIVMRVWERGVGETKACGTGACATLAAAAMTERTDRQATVALPGGDLIVNWRKIDDVVFMTGPAATEFTGTIEV